MNRQLKAQIEGGKLLGQIKQQLIHQIKPGTKLEHIDKKAEKLLTQTGGQPSFKMVPGYFWSTCINLNSGIVHGIPKGTVKSGDIVTLDIGLFYQGYHTDTSTTFIVGQAHRQTQKFLQTGKDVLAQAISVATAGNRVYDISQTIQEGIESAGYSVVRNLTGHGVGTNLHEDPPIPCFVSGKRSSSPRLFPNQAIAIEVMYCQGHSATILDSDGWTITTRDGQLSAVFEETVIVTSGKPLVVTAIS